MRYRVYARSRIVDGALFNIEAEGCQQAARRAGEELHARYPGVTFISEKRTKEETIIRGEDASGDMCLRAFVTPFPETKENT